MIDETPDLPDLIGFAETPLSFHSGELIPTDDPERVALVWPGPDTVLSVQPDGCYETRPREAVGAYEKAILDGDRLIYEPIPGTLWVVPFVRRA
jgi:hypothetical protein